MTNAKIILPKLALSKITLFQQLKSSRTSAELILTTLMLVVAAATTAATAQTYTDLYNFDGTHGCCARNPQILAQGRDGNLYGTDAGGGTNGDGVVFKITPDGALTVVYNFDGVHGSLVYGGLTLGADGAFYGATIFGGHYGDGTIFKITPAGALTTLYSFTGGEDGVEPNAPPIQATDGNFYGTSSYGAAAYKITSSGTFTVLGSLPGDTVAPLLQGTDGNFYGTTFEGGNSGYGAVFKVTPKGVVTVVYAFDGPHGENPYPPLVQGRDGNIYGDTVRGGSLGGGVLFKLTPQGTITVLHNFPDPNFPDDGTAPVAGLVPAADGTFYGVTTAGGSEGDGVIFQITPAGAYSILYNFDGADGASPWPTPMQHTSGSIYGLTAGGGTSSDGVVYSFDMGLGPFVSLLSAFGKVGTPIGILGQGFTGTTNVAFNGTAATIIVVSDTYLTAKVPSGATTGFVTVTTPTGTLTSNKKFIVKP